MAAARGLWAAGLGTVGVVFAAVCAPTGHADPVGYLVNVTVRPGYNFPDAEAALSYGHGVCEQVGRDVPFTRLVREIMADFSASDEYQATYLISQAVDQLCPHRLWQLRRSAAHYTGPVS